MKTSEEELRFQGLLDAAPDAMVVVDQDGKIVLVNTQTERLFGYQREDILGREVEVLLPDSLHEQHRLHRKDFIADPHVRPMGVGLELFGLRKGGTEFPVEVSLGPVETREGVWVTSAIRDITERKLVDESRFRLAAIVESSDDAIISKNLAAIITSWNTGAQRMFGYTESEALGQPITILIPPELEDEESQILKRLRAGERIEHYETIRMTKVGKRINVSLSIAAIRDSSGKMVGFSKIARDITDRRLAEEALADVSRQLIETQEKERTRIARELHDDINQRLALLAIGVDTLMFNPPNSAAELSRQLTEVREAVNEVSSEVQSIAHQLHSPKLEHLGLVSAMTNLCRELATRQKAEIDFKSDDIPELVSHDTSFCLFRILQEALQNAVKHSGVRQFEVRLGCASNRLHLTISDRGAGFDVESVTKKGRLGLVSMRERVRLMSGTILIESTPMGGTTVHVHVPFVSDAGRAV